MGPQAYATDRRVQVGDDGSSFASRNVLHYTIEVPVLPNRNSNCEPLNDGASHGRGHLRAAERSRVLLLDRNGRNLVAGVAGADPRPMARVWRHQTLAGACCSVGSLRVGRHEYIAALWRHAA